MLMAVESEKICNAFDHIKFRETCSQLLMILLTQFEAFRSLSRKSSQICSGMLFCRFQLINEDEEFLAFQKKRIFDTVDQFLKFFDDYLKTYDFHSDSIKLDHSKFLEQLNTNQPPLDQCRQDINVHMDEMDKVFLNLFGTILFQSVALSRKRLLIFFLRQRRLTSRRP